MNKRKKSTISGNVTTKKRKQSNHENKGSKIVKKKTNYQLKNVKKKLPSKESKSKKNVAKQNEKLTKKEAPKHDDKKTLATKVVKKRGRKPKQVKTERSKVPKANINNKNNLKHKIINDKSSAIKRPIGRPRLKQDFQKDKPNSTKKIISKREKKLDVSSTSTSRTKLRSQDESVSSITVEKKKKGRPARVSSPLFKSSPTNQEPSPEKLENNILKSSSQKTGKMATKQANVKKPRNCPIKSTRQVKKVNKRKTGLRSKLVSNKRLHRVASLNASAKVKLLCESDRDSSSVNMSNSSSSNSNNNNNNLNKSDNNNAATTSNENSTSLSDQTTSKSMPIASKSNTNTTLNNNKKNKGTKSNRNVLKGSKLAPTAVNNRNNNKTRNKKSEKNETLNNSNQNRKKIITKRKAKRKRNSNDMQVEIIDTRRCKRMASLNASAMMAATYLPETSLVKSPVRQSVPPVDYVDSLSNVSNTIDSVVRQWSSSTVQQHIEISPVSADSSSDQKCKTTTVKTTVKHVKLRRTNTVVETISTQYEHQNIEETSSLSPTGPKTSKRRRKKQNLASQFNSASPISSSSSAFTPCSMSSISNSLNSMALFSTQSKPFAPSTSFTVQKSSFSSNSSSNGLNQDFTNNNKRKRNSTNSKSISKQKPANNQSQSKGKSRSIIRQYEVKTIETRMESTVDQSECPNSPASNSILLSNNSTTSSILNLNAPIPALSNNAPLMSYNLFHPMSFQLIPSNTNLINQSPHQQLHPQIGRSSFFNETPNPVSYINFNSLNTPVIHYQPITSTVPNVNSVNGFSSPISVPFVQLANSAQPYNSGYNLISPRPNSLPVHSLFGVSYMNQVNPDSGLYHPQNASIINLLPQNPDPASGCTLVHRPVPYHPQSGQISPVNSSSNNSTNSAPNFINNTIYAHPQIIGNASQPSSNQSNIFQYPVIRPPTVPSAAAVRQINLPITSFSQPAVFLQTPVSTQQRTVSIANITPTTYSNTLSSNRIDSSSTTFSLVPNNTFSNFNLSNTQLAGTNMNSVKASNYSPSSHIQQLSNMANQIRNDLPFTSNTVTKLNTFAKKSSPQPLHHSTPIKSSNNSNNIVLNQLSVSHANGRLDHSLLSNQKIVSNGSSPTQNLTKSSYCDKTKSTRAEHNGSINVLCVKNSNRPAQESNRDNISNTKNKVLPQTEMVNKPTTVEISMTNSSPINNSRLLSNNSNCNNLKQQKNRRPIVHGWSWEGEHFNRLIFINNDDQAYSRKCYPAIKHVEGEIIRVRDCVLLKSGPRKTDLPFVAKITALWESPENEMMMSLLWYYRPEHTDIQENYINGEIYASRHRDTNSVACIDDKCYVLTYNEYCRYKRTKRLQQQYAYLQPDKTSLIIPQSLSGQNGFSRTRIPPLNILPELVFCCRKVYDFRQKRILKNPNLLVTNKNTF